MLNVFEYENNGQFLKPPMVSKMQGIKLKRGERVRLSTPGGGGWGDPAKRSASARQKDAEHNAMSAKQNFGESK